MRVKSHIVLSAATLLALNMGAAIGLLVPGSPACAGGSCQGHWWTPPWPADSGFELAKLINSGRPNCFGKFDPDGPGPAPLELIVGGDFDQAPGGLPISSIARYTNGSWAPLGDDLIDIDTHTGTVFATLVFDLDGPGPQPESLIVGGAFKDAEGLLLNNIARWDGTMWHAIGTGFAGAGNEVRTMVAFDSDGDGPLPQRLFVGGNLPLGNLRVWTGASWGTVSGGVSGTPSPMGGDGGTVNELAVMDFDGPGPEAPSLVVGGGFSLAGGGTANPLSTANIARWDGTTWHPLASGLFGVGAIELFDLDGDGPDQARLIVGGSPGGSQVRMVFWDDTSWQPLGDITSGGIFDFGTFDPDAEGPEPRQLFAGGRNISGADGLLRWTGTRWERFAGGTENIGQVFAVGTFDFDGAGPEPEHLIIGGEFDEVGTAGSIGSDHLVPVTNFARWGCFVECPADLDESGLVDGIDLAQLLVTWTGAASYRPCQPPAPADFNDDCRIDGIDLAVLLVSWGDQCP